MRLNCSIAVTDRGAAAGQIAARDAFAGAATATAAAAVAAARKGKAERSLEYNLQKPPSARVVACQSLGSFAAFQVRASCRCLSCG